MSLASPEIPPATPPKILPGGKGFGTRFRALGTDAVKSRTEMRCALAPVEVPQMPMSRRMQTSILDFQCRIGQGLKVWLMGVHI